MSTLPKAVPSRAQQPFQNTWGQVHRCLWMESEDGWLVADKVSLKKWIFWWQGLDRLRQQGCWNGHFSTLGES